MKRIFKYSLAIKETQSLILPLNFKPIYLAIQNDIPCLWAEVDTNEDTGSFVFACFGTGHELPDWNMKHLGSVQVQAGAFVFHYYLLLGQSRQ